MTLDGIDGELKPLTEILRSLRAEGRILIALLYGSYAEGTQHGRSDIDLALYVDPMNRGEEIATIDEIVSSLDRDVSILRLDDEDESPFIVQAALKGIHLVEPDEDALYRVADRALHASEGIRSRRVMHV